ncbi:hypothetical protein JX265_013785 [Neoarthrinium moseri]|uniref:Fumarylacetoacetase-like C-terminal domain-containing protein n=1 Tax=Neoarthrinium moseri TaxID=1658444 RepID=A0A9Q0AHD0_9PEZI|nr:uncharacterized protein JN550_010326 [Neoarthrinium moseri]KAI1848537.1 hypothetical protein JX265_013785 [Neoarthrinium moseri]KAI1862319.1 hypothetical protein JN550_010326 [Neoarthrinium moseri]
MPAEAFPAYTRAVISVFAPCAALLLFRSLALVPFPRALKLRDLPRSSAPAPRFCCPFCADYRIQKYTRGWPRQHGRIRLIFDMNVFRRTMSSAASLKNARKVVCIGRNYADHIAELNSARPKQPFFFLKPSSSILLPGEGPVIRPRGVDLHYEVELALIMGKTLKNLEASDEKTAFDAIESYALGIDMTARNAQWEAKKKGLPWSISKGFDTFLPMSNIIPKSAIPNPHKIDLYLSVNDKIQQSDSTELMLFQIPRILSDISKVMTLEQGDIVITGTPKGVGPVVPGDVMKAGIKIDGKELEEAKIEVQVEESKSTYVFAET